MNPQNQEKDNKLWMKEQFGDMEDDEDVQLNPLDKELQFEETHYPKRSKIIMLKSVYQGRPNTCFFPFPDFLERKHNQERVIYPEEVGKRVPSMYYRMPNISHYRTVKCLFEFAGFKCTKDDLNWHGYWGRLKRSIQYPPTS